MLKPTGYTILKILHESEDSELKNKDDVIVSLKVENSNSSHEYEEMDDGWTKESLMFLIEQVKQNYPEIENNEVMMKEVVFEIAQKLLIQVSIHF